jgi:hypothetical protein
MTLNILVERSFLAHSVLQHKQVHLPLWLMVGFKSASGRDLKK